MSTEPMSHESEASDDLPRPGGLSTVSVGLGLLLGGLLLVALLVIGFLPRKESQEHTQEAKAVLANPKPEVVVVLPRIEKGERVLTLPGGLEAFQEIKVNARVDGYVRKWLVDIGDRVRLGQRLAIIEAPELQQRRAEAAAAVAEAEAQVAQAQAEVRRIRSERARLVAEEEQARAEVGQNQADIQARRSDAEFAKVSNDRWQALVSDQAISLQEADQRATTYQAAKANVQAAQEKLLAARSRVKAAQAREVALKAEIETGLARVRSAQAQVAAKMAAVDRIDAELAFCQVQAPFAGQITQRLIDVGSLVSAGGDKTTLFVLARSNRLRVFVDVPENDVPSIFVGQKATLELKEFRDRTFTGEVTRTAGALDKTTRTLKVQIELNNPGMLDPGMHADVHLAIVRKDPAPIVPATAVVIKAEGPHVVEIDDTQHIHFKPVVLGLDLGKEMEVVKGLTGQEHLVNFPSDSLVDGAEVQPQEKKS